jgi:hypothetical protein
MVNTLILFLISKNLVGQDLIMLIPSEERGCKNKNITYLRAKLLAKPVISNKIFL